VEVEAHLQRGLPAFAIVGLADRACQEAKERVRSGIASAELEWPLRRITVNLAPAELRKEGSGFDLPIALAILAASRQVPVDALMGHAAVGELALDGRLRPVGGVLAAAEGARQAGLTRLLCAAGCAAEAALAGIEPVPLHHLAEAVDYLRGDWVPPPVEKISLNGSHPEPAGPDLADVRGQERARRALELAATGGHNLLLGGPPGTGKTMLARRLPGILPRLPPDEALEITRIHSVAGLLPPERPLVSVPPFRAPHHTASVSAIVGGGPNPRPGEASLAHHGVLFLDELAEFPRNALEALRQPLEDGAISIARVGGRVVFPARFQLIATAKRYFRHRPGRLVCADPGGRRPWVTPRPRSGWDGSGRTRPKRMAGPHRPCATCTCLNHAGLPYALRPIKRHPHPGPPGRTATEPSGFAHRRAPSPDASVPAPPDPAETCPLHGPVALAVELVSLAPVPHDGDADQHGQHDEVGPPKHPRDSTARPKGRCRRVRKGGAPGAKSQHHGHRHRRKGAVPALNRQHRKGAAPGLNRRAHGRLENGGPGAGV
jgi:hypothetical protein